MLQTAISRTVDTEDPEDSITGMDGVEGTGFRDEDEEFYSGKIYCANCIHCKLIPAKSERGDQYVLRIRCAAGKWKKKLGEEKFYKYCTIFRRFIDACDSYEAMGDTREFIRELRKTLSTRDEVFPIKPVDALCNTAS